MSDSTIPPDNPYQAPKAELHNTASSDSATLYVVSPKKAAILFILTLGLYSLYWFYSNYQHIKKSTGESIMPVPRSIFQEFFTYNLFRRIQHQAESEGTPVDWTCRTLAPAYILLSLFQFYADRISAFVSVISLLTLLLSAYIISQVQVTTNAIHNDTRNEINSRFTFGNYVWCIIGVLFWIFLIIDSADALGLIEFY